MAMQLAQFTMRNSGWDLGAISVPLSKSDANRALVLASLAGGKSVFGGFDATRSADDIRLMWEALGALGAGVFFRQGELCVLGGNLCNSVSSVMVGSAGTVLRFLLPLVALHCSGPVRFVGSDRLFERPLRPLIDALEKIGAAWREEVGGGLLIPSKRGLDYVEMEIDGSLSSQFVSGAALAIGGLPKGGAIRLLGAPVSRGYLSLSKLWLERFGCKAAVGDDFFEAKGNGLRPVSARLLGDWSAGAVFFCAAAVLGGGVAVSPLDCLDGQPDAAILSILENVGCTWHFEGERCYFRGQLNGGIRADLIGCPDLAPLLAVTAVFAPGDSELWGLDTLRGKECDRLACSVDLVGWLGGRAELLSETAMRISPRRADAPGPSVPFDPRGDHRMAFAAAIGGLRLGGELLNPGCVGKSFPGFFEFICPTLF
jgi:3-phosphoshikimate 1-carboxyvinyltransferase